MPWRSPCSQEALRGRRRALEGAAGAAQHLAARPAVGRRGAVRGGQQRRVGAQQRIAPLVQLLVRPLDLRRRSRRWVRMRPGWQPKTRPASHNPAPCPSCRSTGGGQGHAGALSGRDRLQRKERRHCNCRRNIGRAQDMQEDAEAPSGREVLQRADRRDSIGWQGLPARPARPGSHGAAWRPGPARAHCG